MNNECLIPTISANTIYFFIQKIINRMYCSTTHNTILYYFVGFTFPHDKTKLCAYKDYVHTNLFCDKSITSQLEMIFCKAQRLYFAFNRLAYLYKLKKASKREAPYDLFLQPLSNLPSSQKIKLLHKNMLYEFRLTDILNMWKTALDAGNNANPIPCALKNPYINLPFKKHHLYNIYFELIHSSFYIPLCIHQFFRLDFNLKLFRIKFYFKQVI